LFILCLLFLSHTNSPGFPCPLFSFIITFSVFLFLSFSFFSFSSFVFSPTRLCIQCLLRAERHIFCYCGVCAAACLTCRMLRAVSISEEIGAVTGLSNKLIRLRNTSSSSPPDSGTRRIWLQVDDFAQRFLHNFSVPEKTNRQWAEFCKSRSYFPLRGDRSSVLYCHLETGNRFQFPALKDFLRSSGSGTGSTQPPEDKWVATWTESSGSV
jgi:hypothetical protein